MRSDEDHSIEGLRELGIADGAPRAGLIVEHWFKQLKV
jgi:hypothetical protein